jgi:hypothetical protein
MEDIEIDQQANGNFTQAHVGEELSLVDGVEGIDFTSTTTRLSTTKSMR